MSNVPAPPLNYPVTGLCIVSDVEKCPTGYIPIQYTHDSSQDGDLWRDSMFSFYPKKRYICFTRHFPLDHGSLNNILESLSLLDEREVIPSGYSPISETQDSKEKALKKKILVAKLVPRSVANEAIIDLVLVKIGNVVPGYTSIGDVGGFCLLCKFGAVPKDPRTYTLQNTDLIQGSANFPVSGVETQTGLSLARNAEVKQLNSLPVNLLDGVKFKLNSGYDSRNRLGAFNVHFTSASDMSDYAFDFSFEKTIISDLSRRKAVRSSR